MPSRLQVGLAGAVGEMQFHCEKIPLWSRTLNTEGAGYNRTPEAYNTIWTRQSIVTTTTKDRVRMWCEEGMPRFNRVNHDGR